MPHNHAKAQTITPKHPWPTDHLNFRDTSMGYILDSSKKLSYQLQRLKPCQDRALLFLLSPPPCFPSGKTGWCCNILLQLCVWCDQIISSYCSILKTCQFLQQKKKVLVMQKTSSLKLLQNVSSSLKWRYHRFQGSGSMNSPTESVFQEQHKYRETTKKKTMPHNLILTHPPSPQAYIKYVTGE